MRFAGKIHKDGTFWLAEVPLFGSLTQGQTRTEALRMIQDWFESMVSHPGFSVTVIDKQKAGFEIGSSDTATLIGLLLQRRRAMSGLSLAEVAERLGARSRTAYARYEQGSSVPSIEKLDQLLRAVSPGKDFLIQETEADYSQ